MAMVTVCALAVTGCATAVTEWLGAPKAYAIASLMVYRSSGRMLRDSSRVRRGCIMVRPSGWSLQRNIAVHSIVEAAFAAVVKQCM